MRGGAVRVVLERFAQVLFGQPVTAAEPSGHLEVPAPERAIGRSLFECAIQAQHRFERLPDGRAVLHSLPQSVRFRERPHVRRHPEMSLGTVRFDRDGRAAGIEARLERAAAFARGVVTPEPVVRARKLPGRLECPWIACELDAPQIRRAPRAVKIAPIGIQRIGRLRRQTGHSRDIE